MTALFVPYPHGPDFVGPPRNPSIPKRLIHPNPFDPETLDSPESFDPETLEVHPNRLLPKWPRYSRRTRLTWIAFEFPAGRELRSRDGTAAQSTTIRGTVHGR